MVDGLDFFVNGIRPQFISNGRQPTSPMESLNDGTIISITKHGSLRKHFGIYKKDETGRKIYTGGGALRVKRIGDFITFSGDIIDAIFLSIKMRKLNLEVIFTVF